MPENNARGPGQGPLSALPLFHWEKVTSPVILRRFASVLLIWTFAMPTAVIAWTQISYRAYTRCGRLVATVIVAILWGFLRLNKMISAILESMPESGKSASLHRPSPGTFAYLAVMLALALGCVHFAGPYNPAGLSFWYFMPVSTFIILMLDRRSALVVLGVTIIVPSIYEAITVGVYAGVLWMAAHAMMILFITACMAAMLMAVQSRSKMTQLAKDLIAANEQLALQSAQSTKLAVAEERNRIAREIHDSVGHSLTVAGAQLEAAEALLPEAPDRARDALEKARSASARGLAEIRRSVSTLRSQTLESLPLAEALQALCTTASHPGLEVKVRVLGATRTLSPLAEVTLLRCAQEGLTNIQKHASATAAVITLDFQSPGAVTITVEDDGKGFPPTISEEGGLAGLKERARLLNGTFVTAHGATTGAKCIMVLPV